MNKKKHTLHQELMAIIWIDVIIFFLIAGGGVVVAQHMYRQNLEKETSNSFEAEFSNIDNTLHFVENIALNIINDKKVKEALKSVNNHSEDQYALIDDLYYRLITSSLVANDALSIIMMDNDRTQYATGSLTGNLSSMEIDVMMELFERRAKRTDPVWFGRISEGEVVYARMIYDFPFRGHLPLGVILIRMNMDKLMIQNAKGTTGSRYTVITYDGKTIYAYDKAILDDEMLLWQVLGDTAQQRKRDFFLTSRDSDFSGISFYGYERYLDILTSGNALILSFIVAILVILIVSFLAVARIVRHITVPIAQLTKDMRRVERGDFFTHIDYRLFDTNVTEMKELARNFNIMTSEIQRLVVDNYLRTIKEREYQIKVLQAQINPHFLYNTLDTINWLAADSGSPEISAMVQALAMIFREATRGEDYMIRLQDELKLLSCYITIQKIRFGDRLDVKVEVPKDCLSLLIPKLSLQPILENSVKYGAEVSLKPCSIEIHARQRNNGLMIWVIDDGPGISAETLKKLRNHEIASHTGIGLSNIEERVQMLGDKGSSLKIFSREGRGTCVKLSICQPGGSLL